MGFVPYFMSGDGREYEGVSGGLEGEGVVCHELLLLL